MKLRDKCWKLGRNVGVVESTVSDCTRGDSTCDEFFTTEAEAWAAEAARLTKERERAEYALCSLREREAEAIKRAGAVSVGETTPE